MSQLAWVDLTLLGVLAVSVLVGLWRGLVFEVMSLVGWVVAYVVAQAFAAQMGQHIALGTPGTATHHAMAFAATFIAALFCWALLSRLVRALVRATPLTWIDRVLGGGFGLLRGLVVCLAVATLVTFTPAVHSAAWTQSQGGVLLGKLLLALKPVLPAEVSRYLPS